MRQSNNELSTDEVIVVVAMQQGTNVSVQVEFGDGFAADHIVSHGEGPHRLDFRHKFIQGGQYLVKATADNLNGLVVATLSDPFVVVEVIHDVHITSDSAVSLGLPLILNVSVESQGSVELEVMWGDNSEPLWHVSSDALGKSVRIVLVSSYLILVIDGTGNISHVYGWQGEFAISVTVRNAVSVRSSSALVSVQKALISQCLILTGL